MIRHCPTERSIHLVDQRPRSGFKLALAQFFQRGYERLRAALNVAHDIGHRFPLRAQHNQGRETFDVILARQFACSVFALRRFAV